MNKKQRLRELENELAEYYYRYRGTMAPSNTWTQGVWREISGLIREVENA